MPDILPHETAVAWTRHYLKKHPLPKGDLDGMEVALRRTLAEGATFINENYDVEGLHSSFPKRVAELIRLKGDRLVQH